MANLSQDDRTIIAERSLDNAPDHLRDSLQKVEQIPSQAPSLSAAIDSSDQGPRNLKHALGQYVSTVRARSLAPSLRKTMLSALY